MAKLCDLFDKRFTISKISPSITGLHAVTAQQITFPACAVLIILCRQI